MKIIAHRGASAYAPENTLTAFEMALDMGAKAVEFDVQMTSDGELVVIHDDFLDRTTSGTGLVIQTPYETIRELDAGLWFAPTFAGEQVPSLEEVLKLLKGRAEVHLEIKKISLETRRVEDAVFDKVRTLGMLDQVLFSSFDHSCLKRLSRLHDARIGVLTGSGLIEPGVYMEKSGLSAFSYNPSLEYVSRSMVEELHAKGIKVYTYTVNDKAFAEAFMKMKVDGIFTNYPDLLSES